MTDTKISRAAEVLIRSCADLKAEESILIVSDSDTAELGEILKNAALELSRSVEHRTIPPFTMHGEEPPAEIAGGMLASDVVIGITKMSMAHSQARLAASEKGARYLSLPDYSRPVMESPAMLADFRSFTGISQKLANILTAASGLTLRTELGTELRCGIKGRVANAAPGWCFGPGIIASPPDAETNIAVLEDETEGVAFIDGSIPCREIGLLASPLKLTFRAGRVVDIEGENSGLLNMIFDRLGNPATRVVAEFGIGLNPLAELRGFMLEDEGCLGTVHLGIGSNATIGGKNKVPFHLDHIIRRATIHADDRMIMQNGVFTPDIQ